MIKKASTKNKASFLMLPMLGQDYSYFDFSERLINCYISFEELREYNRHLFLLYSYPEMNSLEPDDLEKMLALEEKLAKDHNNNKFIELKDITEQHILAIYEINDQYLPEFEIFKQSKYSYLSPKYKEEIIKFHNPINVAGLTKVLNRDKEMLTNIHRNTGCMKTKCNCKNDEYIQCKYFDNFEFDIDKSECWSLIGEDEHLTKDKYEIRDKVNSK